jgi:sphingomyelin phosphodiesterase
MVDLYGQAILDSVQRADISEDGKAICHALGSLCPAPAITSGTLRFPKAKPANAAAPAPSGQQVDVLHLSE